MADTCMHKYVNVRKCVQILSECDSSMLDNIQIMTAIAIASLKTWNKIYQQGGFPEIMSEHICC